MISFIVPAHNEEACLAPTLQAIHESAVEHAPDVSEVELLGLQPDDEVITSAVTSGASK